MSDMRYFGSYVRFETVSKKSGVLLLNADNLIGDRYEISFEVEEGKTVAWLYNKFGSKVGFFSNRDTYQLDVLRAREWHLHALLSAVLYTEKENKEGMYWGEVAVVASPERYDAEIENYLECLRQQFMTGIRPAVDLTETQIDTMLREKGKWVSPDHVSMPDKSKDTAVVKSEQSLTEKLIEKGRAGNKGCYAISYAFIAVLIAIVCGIAGKLLGFF